MAQMERVFLFTRPADTRWNIGGLIDAYREHITRSILLSMDTFSLTGGSTCEGFFPLDFSVFEYFRGTFASTDS
jgi:hypothetical protein